MKPCPNCKTEIADNAGTCPKCGHRMPTGAGVVLAILIGLIGGGFLLWFLTRNL